MLIGVARQTSCHGALAEASTKVVQLCEGPGATQLLPFLLLIAVLLAPDLSELAIPGLLSVKRRVEEQGRRQETLEAELVRVEQRVAMRQDTAVHVYNNIHEASESLDNKITWMGTADQVLQAEQKEEEEEEEEEAEEARPEPPVSDDTWASLTMQLSYLLRNLEQYESISRLRRIDRNQQMPHLSEDQQERVDRWYDIFGEELGAAKRIRNAVRHDPNAVSIEELQEATRIGRRLMRILLTGLGMSTEPVDQFENE